MKSGELIERYGDLIGAPYLAGGRDARTGIDCAGLVSEVLQRQGVAIPDGALDATPAGVPVCWRRLRIPPDALRVGDVIYSTCEGRPHISVVVAQEIVATTTRARGVRLVPLRAITNTIAAYRLREEPSA